MCVAGGSGIPWSGSSQLGYTQVPREGLGSPVFGLLPASCYNQRGFHREHEGDTPVTAASCVFCDIARGKAPASVVYADDEVMAFMDIQPVNPGHVLIVPNEHATYLADLPEETGAHIFRVAQRLTAAIRSSGVRCEGINFFLADGEAAMQEVFHVHFHVFPRFQGDGFGLTFADRYFTKPPRSDLEQAAASIRKQLGDNRTSSCSRRRGRRG